MSGLRYAYCTNGLRDHRLDDALGLLADHGYAGVALTLDHGHLDPLSPGLPREVDALRRQLDRLGLAIVIETGARYVLDPRRKHEPTLLSDDGRDRRLSLLVTAIRIGGELGAEAVHLWSGRRADRVPADVAWARLVDGCGVLLSHAGDVDVPLAFEPEPGMFIDRLARWFDLATGARRPPAVRPHARPGALSVRGGPIGRRLCAGRRGPTGDVQIEDMRRGVHEHLDFGDGGMDFPPALAALHGAGYDGLVAVELSRHSHTAHTVVPRAIAFLREAERAIEEAVTS